MNGVELVAVASGRAAGEAVGNFHVDAVVPDLNLQQGSGIGVMRSPRKQGLPVSINELRAMAFPRTGAPPLRPGRPNSCIKTRSYRTLPAAFERLAACHSNSRYANA